MLALVLVLVLSVVPRASSFAVHGHGTLSRAPKRMGRIRTLAMANLPSTGKLGEECAWTPQDLTEDRAGFAPIPDDDYVKKYQRNPEMWPVEFFLIVYRRVRNEKTKSRETQLLVRESANGTSKWGLGTGVPATRWALSTQENLPRGYRWSEPRITFHAKNFPEFPKSGDITSWTYDKIDICEDAFHGADAAEFQDPELEEYAVKIREGLRRKLFEQMEDTTEMDWEAKRVSVVKRVVDKANSVAAIQGTLRMSGIFARKQAGGSAAGVSRSRFVDPRSDAADPEKLVQSVRIYTMFPQMPDPMPLPSTTPEELQKEIQSRETRMAESGRDPHQDCHGRRYTHKSTSNVSNTIHGVYLTLDATGLLGLDGVPALDLFGTKPVKREWKSLRDLKVLSSAGEHIGTEDTKATFISGFVVRQLVEDGVIKMG